ncbi:MAG TPA: DNA polymerase Y family protein [Chiayiivirga sp.]|nr:DNA polymerase Y family protein [Chiayiivirga sp.]
MLWACILLPHLALDGVLRHQPDTDRPRALVCGPTTRRRLHSVDALAERLGLKAGMALTAAQALQPDLCILAHDSGEEARWQQFLASWAYRYSSKVSTSWPACVLLEVEASFNLLGSWPRIQARLRDELTALGFSHRIALAPTPGAARILAGVHDGLAVLQPEPMLRALDQVSVLEAPLPCTDGQHLWRMGIRNLGALRRLPRAALRQRTDPALLPWLDRVYGDKAESLPLYLPPERFDQRLELGYAVEQSTALLFPLRRLVQDLCTFLSIRDGGVQNFLLRLEHEHGQHDIAIHLLAPEREPALVFELVRPRLEQARITQPVTALRLVARDLPPFVPAMRELFDQRDRQHVSWPHLCERLRARLGEEAVRQLAIACDPRPERAWRWQAEGQPSHAQAPPRPPRPLWLLPRPIPLRDRPLHILAGPERLESGWWDGADARRDYYVLESPRGQRAWAFAAPGEQDNWMLHGWFA